jgi:hypothetical protein
MKKKPLVKSLKCPPVIGVEPLAIKPQHLGSSQTHHPAEFLSRTKLFLVKSTAAALLLTGLAFAKDHSSEYQMGTLVTAEVIADGTITSTLHGDGTTVAGGVYANHVGIYTVRVENGSWKLETMTQANDAMLRRMGMTPAHFKSEKSNPLDALKNGDKVLFRVERHKKLNGTETDAYIPYADNPNKEVTFVAIFVPDVVPQQAHKPSDNVKAMCDAHKLSPELQKQFCSQ